MWADSKYIFKITFMYFPQDFIMKIFKHAKTWCKFTRAVYPPHLTINILYFTINDYCAYLFHVYPSIHHLPIHHPTLFLHFKHILHMFLIDFLED